jgi:hypothetical protein
MTLKINPNELASIEIHQGLNAKIQSYAWERYGKSLVYDPVAKDSEDWVTFETLINDLLSRANAGLEKKIDRKNSSLYRLLDGINPSFVLDEALKDAAYLDEYCSVDNGKCKICGDSLISKEFGEIDWSEVRVHVVANHLADVVFDAIETYFGKKGVIE